MKKMLLIALCSCTVGLVNAQFTKGQQLIGPSLSFNTSNTSEKNLYPPSVYERIDKSFSVGLGFDVLKFVSPKKANGWRFNYTFGNFKSTNEKLNSSPFDFSKNVQNNHEIGVGYVTRRFIPIRSKLNFYYDIIFYGSYNYGKISNEYTLVAANNYNATSNGYRLNAFITPGFTYQLKKNLIIDAALNSIGSIGYYNRKETSNNITAYNYERKFSGFNANSSLSSGALLSNFWFSIKWIR
jgi:hypothetical protein